jgi:hypothetical protein
MKRFIITSLAILGAVSLQAASITVAVPANTAVNVLGNQFSGSAKVKSVAITSAGASSVTAYDSITNVWTYTTPAFTNTISYATNSVVTWTNYYGVISSWTNIVLVDVTNNVVASATNTYPARFSLSCLANTTTAISPTSYVFENGLWVTNTTASAASLTVSYTQ